MWPSVIPWNFTLIVWDSDMYPAIRGAILSIVKTRRTGSLLKSNMHGWVELASV